MEEVSAGDTESPLPFSDAIVHEGTVYVSGQGPLDPETGEVVGETVTEQTRQTLENVERILDAASTSLDNAVKVTVYLMDMDDYETVNAEYVDHVSRPYPARTAVQVADLPVDIAVEIDVIAAR